jgi:hypothetical protein
MIHAHVPRQKCNKLLSLLRKYGHQLPKDSRTLLQTPRSVNITEKCGGKYVYFGLKKYLQMAQTCEVLEVQVNKSLGI